MTRFDLNTGATAPLANEIDLTDLPVTGTLPLQPPARPFRGQRRAVLVAAAGDAACHHLARRPRHGLPQPLGPHPPVGARIRARAGRRPARHQSQCQRAAPCRRNPGAGRRRRAAGDDGGAGLPGRQRPPSRPGGRHDRAPQDRSRDRRVDELSRPLGAALAALWRGGCPRSAAAGPADRGARAVDDARHGHHRPPQHPAGPERGLRLLDAVTRLPHAAALARRAAIAAGRDPAPWRAGTLVRGGAVFHPARGQRLRGR